MKKLISFVLAAVMLVSVFCMNANAAELIFHDEFDGFKPANWITDRGTCAFSLLREEQMIEGYSDAVVLQSAYQITRDPKSWDAFYASMDVQVLAYDGNEENEEDWDQTVMIWVRDASVYFCSVDLRNWTAQINKNDDVIEYYDESGLKTTTSNKVVVAGPVEIPEEIRPVINQDAKSDWFKLGVRVDVGQIDFYFNDTLLCSAKNDPNDEFIKTINGEEIYLHSLNKTIGTVKTPYLFWNIGNWIRLDNFKVYTPDFDPTAKGKYGDVNDDGKIDNKDVIALLKYLAKWDGVTINEAMADVNCDSKVTNIDVTTLLKYLANWEGIVLGK